MSWVERQRNIVDFTLALLLRRRRKQGALLAVYTLVIFVVLSGMFLGRSLAREATIILNGGPDVVVQKISAGRQSLVPLSDVEGIRRIAGATGVRGRLWGYYYEPATGANYTLIVPAAHTCGPGCITVGRGVAASLDVEADDLLPMQRHDGSYRSFAIGEVLPEETSLLSHDLVIMSEEDFRDVSGLPASHVTDVVLSVAHDAEREAVLGEITRLLPDARVITRKDILRTYETIFDQQGGLGDALVFALVLVVAILAWDKATGLSPEERREIGALKAMGWKTSDVVLCKVWEGGITSVSAFLLGVMLAYAHVFLASAVLLRRGLRGWAVLSPDFAPVPWVDGLQLALVLVLVTVPYTVATIIPSWRAALGDPDAVLRS